MLNANTALHRGSLTGRVVLGTLFVILMGLSIAPIVCAQRVGPRAAPPKAQAPQQRGVTVGSDYFVPIPEVRLNNLVDKKKTPPQPEAKPEETIHTAPS